MQNYKSRRQSIGISVDLHLGNTIWGPKALSKTKISAESRIHVFEIHLYNRQIDTSFFILSVSMGLTDVLFWTHIGKKEGGKKGKLDLGCCSRKNCMLLFGTQSRNHSLRDVPKCFYG